MADAATGGATKVCGICGVDCSGKPRTKDAKGNYVCMECVERAKTAKAAQSAPKVPVMAPAPAGSSTIAIDDDNSFLLGMGSSATAKPDGNSKPCPSCFKPMPAKAVMCVNCGYNAKSGEQLHVRVLKPKEEKGPKSRATGSWMPDLSAGAFFGIVLGIGFGPAALGFLIEQPIIMMIGIALMALISLCVTILLLVDAFQDSVTSGVIMVVLLFVTGGILGFAFQIYWVFAKTENDALKASWMANVVGIVGMVAVIMTNPEGMEGFMERMK